jgi:hypothetical protein
MTIGGTNHLAITGPPEEMNFGIRTIRTRCV